MGDDLLGVDRCQNRLQWVGSQLCRDEYIMLVLIDILDVLYFAVVRIDLLVSDRVLVGRNLLIVGEIGFRREGAQARQCFHLSVNIPRGFTSRRSRILQGRRLHLVSRRDESLSVRNQCRAARSVWSVNFFNSRYRQIIFSTYTRNENFSTVIGNARSLR